MTECNHIQDLMQDVLAGSAAQGGRPRLEEHLASCDACRGEWALLQQITAVPVSLSDPGEAFWEGYHDQLVERMDREASSDSTPARIVHLIPRRAMQVAAAIVLISMGVLLGRTTLSDDVTSSATTETRADLVALDAEAFSVLDRSRTLLLDVVNFDVAQDRPADLNLNHRQDAANRLVRETADLRNRLSEAERQRMINLLSDLEVILLQLAHMDAEVDLPQIEMMQQGMDRKAILFKIDIESMHQEQSEAGSTAATTSPQPRRSAI